MDAGKAIKLGGVVSTIGVVTLGLSWLQSYLTGDGVPTGMLSICITLIVIGMVPVVAVALMPPTPYSHARKVKHVRPREKRGRDVRGLWFLH